MSTPEKWLDAAALPYPDHASFLDGHTLSADLVMKQAQMALSLRDELKRSEQTRHWLIERLNAECARAGFELMWADGGGSACPGGWHRNPYIGTTPIETVRAELAECRAKLAECVDKAAAIIGTGPEMAEGPNHGVVLAALDWLVTTKAQAEQSVKSCDVCGEETSTGAGHALKERAEKAERDLAAAQANVRELREALESVFRSRPWLGDEPDMVPARRVALSTPTGSRAALREMLTKAVHETDANPHEDPEAIVARLLGGGK